MDLCEFCGFVSLWFCEFCVLWVCLLFAWIFRVVVFGSLSGFAGNLTPCVSCRVGVIREFAYFGYLGGKMILGCGYFGVC